MNVEVVFLPGMLDRSSLASRAVVVFDVLRATTTITAALATGIKAVHVFADLNEAAQAAKAHPSRPILCGEHRCVAPPGFDLGNSPGQFSAAHRGREVFLSTTNGTKALAAAIASPAIFAGALVNASAVAARARATQLDIVLLCAGTSGQIAMEDVLGAGAVASAIGPCNLANDATLMALELFNASKSHLPKILRQTHGGCNVIAAGLEPDIDFAARLDVFDVVARADPNSLILRPG